jgi:glutamate dehydrogenase
MADKYKEEFTKAHNVIIAALPKDASADVRALVGQFYAKLPLIDLEALNPKEAAAVAASSYDFLRERTPGVPKIRIAHVNTRTVIEILNDDMPFLVDSVTMELSRLGLAVGQVVHPIIRLKRDAKGTLLAIAPADDFAAGYITESLIRVEISRLPETITPQHLTADLLSMLQNVRYAVSDWATMNEKIADSIKSLAKAPADFKQEEVSEIHDFLTWLTQRNFVFLGYVEYDFYDEKGKARLSVVPESELGIFRSDDEELKPKGLEGLPPEVLHFALVPQLIEITKSLRKAVVHRPVHMDYIGIKRFDAHGKVIGERRFLGLFTSSVYYQSANDIPFIRRKIARVLARASFDPASHDGKSLKAILEFTPRDELFQFPEDELFDYAMGVLSLESKPGVRLFTRRDAFERFVSCIVFVPRERFSTSLREEVQVILARAFEGTVTAYYTQMTDSPLARLHLIIATTPGHIPQTDTGVMEAQIAKVTHRWSEGLFDALCEHMEEEAAESILHSYAEAFPNSYIHDHDAGAAVYDIQKIQDVMKSGTPALELFRNKSDADSIVHLKWYNPQVQIPLSDVLPMLENMGFKVIDEQPYEVKPRHAAMDTVWIRDFTLSAEAALVADIAPVKPLFEEALTNIWRKELENDALGGLVLRAHLHWREVMLLRAYAKYLRQVGFPYSLGAVASALNRNHAIAHALVALFHARFDPQHRKDTAPITQQIEAQLADVTAAADDRILRRIADLIGVTLRTNYYQTTKDGAHKPYLSFKLDSANVPELPLPRPFAEIFVYSARMEGIHLRGGKVARGGLRWSDRNEDFRTEILGLMKAQMVKNAVIVPVGSKGGFVLKQAPAARDAFMEEGVACYKIFLSGLLDITDNIVVGKTVPPVNVVRHDGDDPYLVVAADKGTATFSDYANQVSAQYGFWLGDAFASGGSVGYDHKKMAITARGAFISVARHFREMDVDIYAQDFSVVGIGDMAGDVFGNGMLLSKHIRLLGAFNHMHIFLDPNPDTAVSFKERERMFNLPRSSWKDYDAKLISKGGGIFERSAKSIPISAEVKKAFGIEKNALSPDELIRAMLLAPVDLLWNGGIGTYVKAEDESHEQVGDRANNALRVNGKELRCKVVGEGGNLGFTQKGRVEYARLGGRINTDAIDNSAGVDCSDHEVNIKIGLGSAVAGGTLTLAKRDTFLATMTDDVAALVLKDNRLQTQALTITEMQAPFLLEEHIRLMHHFEKRGLLDRVVEFLPSDKQLAERKSEGKGLTRPELAVMLAYSKMVLYTDILASSLPDDAYFKHDLVRYFPPQMQTGFAKEIAGHQLRREIVATAVTNSIVNRTGITLIHTLAEESGLASADVARAYVAARDIFGLRELWAEVEALDGKVHPASQVELFRQITFFVARVTLWFLRNVPQPLDIGTVFSEFQKGIAAYTACYKDIITPAIRESYQEKVERFTQEQIPEALAAAIAGLDVLASACDVVRVSNDSGYKLEKVGALYFQMGDMLKLDWLRSQAARIGAQAHWDRLAIYYTTDSLFNEQRRLTVSALAENALEDWQGKHAHAIERFDAFVADLKTGDTLTLPKLVIAAKKVEEVGR